MDVKGVVSVVVLVVVALGVTVWLGENATSEKQDSDNSVKPLPSLDEEENAPPVDDDDRRPKAVTDETLFEFGLMEVGQTERHTFKIRNEGEDTLVIAKGASTCKCTVSDLPDNQIPPGKSADVNLEWEPKAMTESFSQTATIWTNDPDRRKIDFRVEGEVISMIEFVPGTDIDAGNVLEETGADTALLMSSSLGKTMTEPEIIYAGEWLTFTTEEITEDEFSQGKPQVGYRINIHVSPRIPVGAHKEVFEVQFEIDGKEFQREITLRCTRRGPVTIIPAPGTVYLDKIRLVDFQRFEAANGRKQAITVVLDDPPSGEAIELSVGEIENPNMKVSVEPNTQLALNKRQAFNVTLEIPPGLPPLDYARKEALKVPLRTTHPVVEEILLRVELHSY